MPTLTPRLIAILAVTFTLACSRDGFDAVDTGTDQYDEPDTELPADQGQPTDDDQQVDDTDSSQQDTEDPMDSTRTDWTECYSMFEDMNDACYDNDHSPVYVEIEITESDEGVERDIMEVEDLDYDADYTVPIASTITGHRLEIDPDCQGFAYQPGTDGIWLIVADGSPDHRPPGYVAPSDND